MNFAKNAMVRGVVATREDEELIRFRGKPNEGLVRFRHAGGDYRRVKLDLDDLATLTETMERCNREFGDPSIVHNAPQLVKRHRR